MKRAGTTREIASVATFLASEASSFTTGAIVPVDGGRNLHAQPNQLTDQFAPEKDARHRGCFQMSRELADSAGRTPKAPVSFKITASAPLNCPFWTRFTPPINSTRWARFTQRCDRNGVVLGRRV